MALTTTIVPASLVTAAQMLYDVSKDELEALRRYVPRWSKNSTLIPIRGKDGKLSYIDFSHMNAYDLLINPIQTVINNVESGRTDKKGLMKDFISGVSEATKELGEPFISSSIWVGALQDVLPTAILGRGGVDEDGRRIYNPNDTEGNILREKIYHLVEALAPFNANQLNRLYKAALPKDTELRFDRFGREYELGKELAGMVGLRMIEANPERGIKYKINQYQKDVRQSRSLFTGTILKGGPISPEEVVDAYINANRALYGANREFYKDIKAAETLGVTPTAIENIMDERKVGSIYDSISQGEFKPYQVSEAVEDLFEFNAAQTRTPNPYLAAENVIDRIQDVLELVPLTSNVFPNIENPFKTLPLPRLLPNNQGNIPTNVQNSAGFVGQQNITLPYNQLSQEQKLDRINELFNNG